MEFKDLAAARYSVRKFSKNPIDPQTIQDILATANLAPTAVNKQPFKIITVTTPLGMDKLATCTPYTFHAPAAFIVCAVEDEAWVRPYDNYNMGVVDATIVATHLTLAIHDFGLGSTWVGYFDPKAVTEQFNIPKGIIPVAIFPFGQPDPTATPAPQHSKRKSLQEIVVPEHF